MRVYKGLLSERKNKLRVYTLHLGLRQIKKAAATHAIVVKQVQACVRVCQEKKGCVISQLSS